MSEAALAHCFVMPGKYSSLHYEYYAYPAAPVQKLHTGSVARMACTIWLCATMESLKGPGHYSDTILIFVFADAAAVAIFTLTHAAP